MKKTVLFLAIFAVIFGSVSLGWAADKPLYQWRAVTHSLPGTYRYKTIEKFCDLVKEASDGRMEIQLYGAGVLFPVFDTFDAVKNGIVEMAMCYGAYWTGKDPQFGVLSTRPGSPLRSIPEGFYLEEQAAPIFERLYKKFGITYLGCISYATPEILMLSTPIRTFEDFKGKNLRSSGLGGAFYSKLGASTVSLSSAEIYTALQTRTIDGAEWTEWKENDEMGLLEVSKYIMDPTYHQGVNEDKALIVTPAKWDALPDDLKEIVLLARDHIRWYSMIENTTESLKTRLKWLEDNKDKGVEIIVFSEEDARKCQAVANELILEQKKLGPEASEYVDVYAKVLHDLGYLEEAAALGYKP
jgi:TRAP-type mannitol/chloroaromatic compound transport system substrate-binding protein